MVKNEDILKIRFTRNHLYRMFSSEQLRVYHCNFARPFRCQVNKSNFSSDFNISRFFYNIEFDISLVFFILRERASEKMEMGEYEQGIRRATSWLIDSLF